MKPAKISCGLGAIRRAQASGSAAGALAGWGGPQVSTTEVPCPGAEMISALAAGVGQARADAVPQARARRSHPGRIKADPVVGDGHRDPARPAAAGGEHGAAHPGVGRDVTQRLPGGGAERLGRPASGTSRSPSMSHRTSSSAADSGRAAQRGPQVGQAVSAAEDLPGQCVLGPPRLGHHDAPRHRLSATTHRPQHAEHVVVHRVRRAPFGFLGGQGRILHGHLPGQRVGVRVGPPRARAQQPGGPGRARHDGERGARLLNRADPRPDAMPRWPGRPAGQGPPVRTGPTIPPRRRPPA